MTSYTVIWYNRERIAMTTGPDCVKRTQANERVSAYCIAVGDGYLGIFSSIRVTALRLASQRESRVIVTTRVISPLQIEETAGP